MKIYLTPPQPSRGLQRIADALVKYKPEWVEVAEHIGGADIVVLYAIGRHDALLALTQAIAKSKFQKYAIIQVCLRSTMKPHVRYWEGIWADAECVWSYYDLEQAVRNDYAGYNPGSDFQVDQFREHVNFYHAPLGADSEVFVPDPNVKKLFKAATSGVSRLQESVRECWLAAKEVGGDVFHLGEARTDSPVNTVYSDGCNDNQLCASYQQCEFVSALRRKEGFELPAAEGLLCGARPIAFDTPDYRWIYKSWAEYIHEGTRQEVVDQLIELFRRGARPVTQGEINEARQWFHWPTTVGGFYERLS